MNKIKLLWNKLISIFVIMAGKIKIKVTDTGLRGRFNGELYVDKKVFFKRDDVRNVIKALKDSESLNKHIKENRESLKLT